MDDRRPPATASLQSSATWPRHRVAVALFFALAVYAALLFPRLGATAGGSDSSGYLNSARLLAQGRITIPARPVEGAEKLETGARAPLGFRVAADRHQLVPTYPTGFPLLILAATTVSDWTTAPNLVAGAHLLAGLLLVYLLARECGLSRPWAALALLLVAVCPLYPFMGLQAMSDVPALVWTTAAVLCALRARRARPWALAGGFAFGFAVLIRPTNALALVPLAFALGADWRAWWRFGLGGVPTAVFFVCYNLAAYGSAFTTGYGDTTASFSLNLLGETLAHYAKWLPVMLTPAVVLVLALPWVRSAASPRLRALLTAWFVVFLGFYSLYYFTHETWWYLRFLLPAFPALIIAALLVLQAYVRRRTPRIPLALAWSVGALCILLNGLAWTRTLRALNSGRDETSYVEVSAWAEAHLPARAVIACMQNSGAFFYYTDFALVRWDWLTPASFQHLVAATADAGRPLYAILQDFEVPDALSRRMPGQWVRTAQVRNVTVWKYEPAS